VQVGGNASLNGTLAVSSLNGFHPVDGNAFEVLRSNGTRSGQFAHVNDFLNNNPNLQRIDVISLFHRFLPAAKKLSDKEKLPRRYFSPPLKIVGVYGPTVGETGYLLITTVPQRATTSQQAALS
jgi:hypothetical protein